LQRCKEVMCIGDPKRQVLRNSLVCIPVRQDQGKGMEEKMKGRTAFVLLLVVSLLLPVVTACTTPTPEVVEKVVVVEAPKEVVVEIEKIVNHPHVLRSLR
jgi:hypothetical protein